MKNLKRVLVMMMTVAMMLSVAVFGTSAAFTDQSKIENTDAVDMCNALNIINGYQDGSFGPTDTVTRGQMAKMICIALNGGSAPTLGTKATPTYTDIKGNWAEAYIEYCTSLGIVSGVGNGKFSPDATVTGTQAAKMLLVALGYDATKEGFNGSNWSVNINVRASQKNLYDDLATIDPNAALTRDSAAQMIYNALEAYMVTYDYQLTTTNGTLQSVAVVKDDGTNTILSKKYSLKQEYGIMTKATYNTTDKDYDYTFISPFTSGVTDITGSTAAVPVANITKSADADFSSLINQQVKVLYKTVNGKDTIYGMYAYKTDVIATGIQNDLDSSNKTSSIKFDGNYYKAETVRGNTTGTNSAANIEAYQFNNYAAGFIALSAVPAQDSVTLLDMDGNGYVDTAIYVPFSVAKVTYVGTKNFTAGGSYTIDDVNVYSGIAKDDFVMKVAAINTVADKDTFTKVDTVLKGKITSTKNDGTGITDVQVNGTWYTLASNVYVNNLNTYKAKTSISKAPVVNGFICAIPDTTAAASVTDYAVVISATNGTGTVTGEQAKLLFSDGTKTVVDTTADYSGAAYVGKLVYFEKNSDNEYTLYLPADAGFVNGFDGVSGTVFTANSSGAVKYIGGNYVADDATIFLNDAGTYKVITGATLNKTAVAGLVANNAYYVDSSSNGYSNIQMAYVTSATKINSADKLYGYVTAKLVGTTNSDGNSCYDITFWNGTKDVTLQTKSGLNVAGVAKGTVIAYTVNSDGDIDSITGYAMAAATHDAPAAGVANTYGVGAIKAYNGDDEVVIAVPVTSVDDDNNATTANKDLATLANAFTYSIDKDDTTILYINADQDNITGVAGGSISLADKDSNSAYAYANAFFIKGTDLNLLVVDINNDILNAQ